MHSLFQTAWDAGVATTGNPLLYEDISGDKPTSGKWAKIAIHHAAGMQAALGTTRFRRHGMVIIEMFAPSGQGHYSSGMDDMIDVAMGAFEGKSTTGGVWFRDVTPREIGPEGPWFQTNIELEFIYDQVR